MAKAGMKEIDFEHEVELTLLDVGGYTKSLPSHFDLTYGIDTAELFAFVGATQAKAWEQIVHRYGGDPDKAQKGFIARLAAEIDNRGTIAVLRDGMKDQMVQIRLAFFKPATSMNDMLAAGYAANRLTMTRQLRYSARHNNTLDVALFLNGLLFATVELKNPLTGQSVDDAMDQYRLDRDAVKDPFLGRALVHFAVDPYLVYMTTKLEQNETTFLPFNRGRDNAKGNPDNPDGYATAYLWESIWARHTILDILARFVHQTEDGETLFPRFHQWDVVVKLEADARERGAGHSYLLQHSAGSGKSNSISWLAHRLSTLHCASDVKRFHKVVVITDRRNLDEQLRATVEQFERTKGVVVAIKDDEGSKSSKLAEALASATCRIIVTTLQTFPFVLNQIDSPALAERTWAIVIDEAHSSQTGDAAAALRQALGAGTLLPDDVDEETMLATVLAARGQQPNMSFFAFTATPKNKTVEIFGSVLADGNKGPFHLYSMRQAIEEGFILDVLRFYATWKSYFRLATVSLEAANKEVDASKAGSALRKILVRHPEVISQKARVIIEHFRAHTAQKLGGLAKAMVVTDSRAAAVKYKLAIDAYIAEKGYDIASLVAFSGKVLDDVAGEVTESSMNNLKESQTGDAFKGRRDPYKPGDYQVLIVAEKFQTGFDEPRLHTMFVDRTLTGLAIVQTLSRLNRTMKGKDDTFILDFCNDPDLIAKEFQHFYETATVIPTDVNVLTDAYDKAIDLGVIDVAEVTDTVAKCFTSTAKGPALGNVYAAFNPALARFSDLDGEKQEAFRAALASYLHLYAFLSQVMTWTDADYERLYIYGRALAQLLPAAPDGRLSLGSDVVLTHLRLEDLGTEHATLQPGGSEPGQAFPGHGRGRQHDPRLDTLGNITEELNKVFGLNLQERDRLAFEQFEVSWLADDELRTVAHANDLSGFRLEFEKKFKTTILDNEEANGDLYERLAHDEKFRDRVLDWYLSRMYELLRADSIDEES
ncbi:MAG: DEAD/DEAH box helicase family protein [Ilumatobacteraceae bacterium]